MIGSLKGEITWKEENEILLDVAGVGYLVETTDSKNLPTLGEEVFIFIHTYVREDEISLFGFKTMAEKKLFEILLTVSRIGPKAAVNILSTLSYDSFINAVLTENIAVLKDVKGIGTKTAQRLVLELKNKVDKLAQNISIEDNTKSDKELYDALLSLGYTAREVDKALSNIDINQEKSLEDKIKRVLTYMGKEGF